MTLKNLTPQQPDRNKKSRIGSKTNKKGTLLKQKPKLKLCNKKDKSPLVYNYKDLLGKNTIKNR